MNKPEHIDHRQARESPASVFQGVQRWSLGLIAIAVLLVILVQGRFFLIPLAVAIMVFSLTSAIIDFIARLRIGSVSIPNWLASVVAVIMIAAGLLAMFGILAAQIDSVIGTASNYTERGQEAVAAMFTWIGDDVAQAFLAAFQDINFGEYLRALAGSAGSLLVTIILIILYVGFLFGERPWFQTKLALMFPNPDDAVTVTGIVTSIKRSVHHYILVKTAVSGTTALVVYGILLLLGVDFAEPLALLTFVLNFIPNIGSIIATVVPTVVALVQFNDWSSVLLLFGLIGVVQFSVGNVIEPTLMGRTLSLSSFAIILSLTFWGAIWGVAGMFLAVPIMVMVMIICAHIPSLRPFAIMLSREGIPVDASGEIAAQPRKGKIAAE